MNNEDIEYIPPNQIGYTELSEEERKIILKAEKKYMSDIYALIISIIALALGIYWAKDGITETSAAYITTSTAWIIILLFTKNKIKFTASARGIVVRKDAIMQKVVPNQKYTYKRYFSEPPFTNQPLTEQEFYYLTVKLTDGRYVRYVNCLKEDFDTLSEGDIILAVCYGFNEIKGYLI